MTTNHPAHGPVSLDRLHQISEILSKAAAQSDGGNLGYAMADAVKVIDWAVAAFGAEPAPVDIEILASVLRNAPLAPSDSQGKPRAPDEDPRDAFERTFKMPKHVTRCGTGYVVTAYSAWLAHDFVRMWEGWNACRAAMLQAGNHTEQHLDMVDHSGDTNENGSDDTFIDEGTKPAGNSPVATDGLIPVSERMPYVGKRLALYGRRVKEDCAHYVDEGYLGSNGFFYFFDWEGGPRIDDCHNDDKATVTHWMYWELPAAPQQEVKNV
ncbi:TPA: hypothetical protein K7686_002217 [Salmonella enterica]|nr:DUF551 domain-containing protein [Salmonella enterica subsp. enterica serovar Kentucky]HAF6029046.1 DUF551 domain-containing protein [Salmonella enterica]HBI5212793.1 hypothetical protein [Salmonella enterica]HBI5272392.1 hypothetical protein [Salmonella enterica]HBI5290133.1 hypothetical protein [Salmonella enterica]